MPPALEPGAVRCPTSAVTVNAWTSSRGERTWIPAVRNVSAAFPRRMSIWPTTAAWSPAAVGHRTRRDSRAAQADVDRGRARETVIAPCAYRSMLAVTADTARITVTLPTEQVAELRKVTDNVSGYVAEAVARQIRHQLLGAGSAQPRGRTRRVR
ncbi:hypothetical protein GCM10009540_79360 [Streptomyces turgidiscabies]